MSDDDPDIDAHLKAALRHAPDRELAPPPALSRDILRAAHDAVKSPQRTPWWSAALALLMRPSFAAAFASVMLVVVVGVMWRDEEGVPPPVVSAPAPAPVPAPTSQAPPAAPAAQPPHTGLAQDSAKKAVPAGEQREAAHEERIDALRKSERRDEAAAPPPTTSPPAPSPTMPSAAPIAAPPPPAPAAVAEAARLQGSLFAPAPRPPPVSLTQLFASAAANDGRWQWRADAQAAPRPMDESMRAWLVTLQAAQGRWIAAPAAGNDVGGRSMQWLVDGEPQATLRIDTHGVFWLEPAGPAMQLMLDEVDLQRLRASMPQ